MPCRRHHAILFAFTFTILLGLGCVQRSEQEVVIYTSVDREFATPILSAFERNHTPCKVASQFDIESTKTVGLVTRILEERDNPRCDVFWNNEILHTIRLQQEGLLESHRWQVPNNWPDGYRASDGTWIGYAARARVLLVNKERLADRASWPSTVRELADPKWKGLAGLALPLFGTTATHFAVLHSQDPSNALAWFQSVADNASVLSGNKQVAQAVSSGQLAWGLTDTDDAMIEQENGMPVEIVFPDQEPSQPGTLFIPNTLAVIKGNRHPNAARQLVDYLILPKTEERLTTGNASQFSIWPGAERRSSLPGGNSVRRMDVDFEKAAQSWSEIIPQLRSIFQAP